MTDQQTTDAYRPGSRTISIRQSCMMLPGYAIWKLRGRPVWMGRIGQPVEDLEFDEVVLHASDIQELKARING